MSANGSACRLPPSSHTELPGRIHEPTAGFELEDLWSLPTPGGPGDLPRLLRLMGSGGAGEGGSSAAGMNWKLRLVLGS